MHKRWPLCLLLFLGACAFRSSAPVALSPGYYVSESPGVYRRVIIFEGARRASYDVWRVSEKPNDDAQHAHFDLIGQTDRPMSGYFAVTQDGSDCGQMWLEPYRNHGSTITGLLIVGYAGASLLFSANRSVDTLEAYTASDDSYTALVSQAAGSAPYLYQGMAAHERSYFHALNPVCR